MFPRLVRIDHKWVNGYLVNVKVYEPGFRETRLWGLPEPEVYPSSTQDRMSDDIRPGMFDDYEEFTKILAARRRALHEQEELQTSVG